MNISLKKLLLEGRLENAVADFIKNIIKGTEWENRIYICGGFVRDELMGRDPKDLDIVVDSPNGGITFAEWITKKIGAYKQDSNPVIFTKFLTAQFRLIGIKHNDVDLSDFKIESVAPRSEVYNDPNSRKPDVVQTDLKGDASRRDLSINALYKNISTGEIIDPSGKGLEDLKNKVLKPSGDPDKVYQEDALRLLRVVRFYAKFNYDIPLSIIKSLKRNAYRLEFISAERIQEELNKMLVTSSPDKAIKLLRVAGLLDYVLPELKVAYKLGQNKFHSQDVFSHSLSVLKNTPPNLITRLCAVLHDIGKTRTRTVVDNEVHFYAHEMVGAKMTRDILTRLKYPNDIIDAVVLGVKNHMRLKQSGNEGEKISDKALRKLSVDLGDHLQTILDLMHSDNISHAEDHNMPNQIPGIIKRLDQLKNTIPIKGQKLPVSGEDLKAIGLKPGPLFKELLDLVKDKRLESPNTTKEEYIEIIKNYLNKEDKK